MDQLRDVFFSVQNKMTLQTFNRVWCKVMLQRYMGAWLDNNLSVDQLSLELANGCLELDNLDINTKAVSQGLAQCNVPLKMVDGYLGKIKIEIPWLRLMTDPTRMCIEDLQLTFRGADVVKVDDMETITSMIESVLMGLNTDDMARSVFSEVSKENNISMELLSLGDDETADSFAGFINAVYSRFCLTVKKLTLRFENEPKDKSEMATAVEVHVDTVTFMDEQMRSCEMDMTNATDCVTTQPHGIGNTTNLNKNLTFHGVSLFTDVFSQISNDGIGAEEDILITSMHIRREKAKQMSPTKSAQSSLHPDLFMSAMSDMDAFHSCYDKLTQECASPDQLDTLRTAPAEPELFSDPIKFAEVFGDISCVFRIKNNTNDVNFADIDESKIETDVFIKGINVFATPSQIDIVKRFFSSVTAPKQIVILEQGKPMGREDYEKMTMNMEPNQVPEGPMGNSPAFGTNWQTGGDVFREFDEKSLRKKDKTSEKERFKTLKASGNVKEEFTVNTHIGTLLMYIPHCDYLSSEYSQQHGGYANVLNYLKKESTQFFKTVHGFSFLSKLGLADIRDVADSFYPKDHLRIVGGAIAVTSSCKRVGSVDTFVCRMIASHFDMLEYLTPESVPDHDGPLRVNLLDYSQQENIERDPNIKVIMSTSSEKKGVTNVEVLLGAAYTELDFSIIDRISNLCVTRPFFDEASTKREQNKVPQLKDDLYENTAHVDEEVKTMTNISLKCSSWSVDLKIPKADLRNPSGSRLPFAQRHVHNEFIRLGIKDIDILIPLGKDATSIVMKCTEMLGDFCGANFAIPKDQQRFLHASRAGFNKIELKLVLNPNVPKLLNRKSSMNVIPDVMLKSVSADIMMAHPKREGPFSKVPRSYASPGGDERDDIVQAGSRQEILDFQEDCENFASTLLFFTVPSLKLHIPEKSYLEVLYNRLVNDLALFQPAAPAFRAPPVSAENAKPLESFQECVSPKNYAESEHSDAEEEIPTLRNSMTSNEFDRDVPHTFVMTLNATKCTMLCNTALKEVDKEAEPSQVSLDLEKVHIGTTAGYHGDINHTFFHFTSTKAAVGSTESGSEVRMPNVTSQKDFGRWTKDMAQLENVAASDELSTGSTEDAFAVALHMNFKPEFNVKDMLIGISLRNSQLQAKPFVSWNAFWATQLADLFTLQDYAIPGYELPTVSTDLHVCLESAIVAYDHSLINPNSKLKLRAFFGHCNLASSIVTDMNLSKTLCIFENCRLYLSHDSLKDAVRFEGYGAPKAKAKKLIPFLDIGSVQLDIMFSVGENTGPKTTPAFEIRCQNDMIKAWACADSLATFIKTVIEYTGHEQIAPKSPEQETVEEMQNSHKSGDEITKSTAAESIWSDASTGSKHVQRMTPGVPLPDDVERRIQAMIQEAVKEEDEEDEETNGIAIGEDAVEEFMSSTPQRKSKKDQKKVGDFEQFGHRMYITDDEFCMVDDNVIGSGITNTPGDSRVRFTPKSETEENICCKPDFYQNVDDSGNDGLYQSIAGDMTPAIRYLLKDFTIQLSLYAGNDLSDTPSPLKTYCTEEFRNGFGPEQKVEEDARGGPNRDHSAYVILELQKITYLKQIFEKTAPFLSTTLFQVGDAIVKDRLRASAIQEMLYHYSCSDQPRRTNAPIWSMRMSETQSREGKMRVSMMPIKVNVDQDTAEFLADYFDETMRLMALPKSQINMPQLAQRPVIEVPAETSKRSTPKTSVSSSEGEVQRMYPSIPPPSLTSEPLKPSPVKPATPLGDLSYLEKISQNHSSPVKRPIIDAPLTASAVSIGAMFSTNKEQEGVDDEEIDPIQMEALAEEIRQINAMDPMTKSSSSSSCTSSSSSSDSEDEKACASEMKQSKIMTNPNYDLSKLGDLSDLAGDWADDDNDDFATCGEDDSRLIRMSESFKCERPDELKSSVRMTGEQSDNKSRTPTPPVRPSRNLKMKAERLSPLKMPHQPLSNDDILMRSTMMGSIHPTQSVHNLVDTSDDHEEEHENFLDDIDDDENEIDKEKKQAEQDMEEQKMDDASAMDTEIQEAVERGETFFKQFVFSPSVNIYVDYQGKRKITVEKAGALVGFLMAFGQLNQMPINLREINTRSGLLGTGRCLQHAVGEWSGDLLTNMPSVIASYGPISPLVQIGRGVVDLFWMPVAEFRKPDGNIVKGVQRGVGSFSVSSAAGIVGMAQTVTGFVQSLAEMTMHEIKPDDPSTRRSAARRYNRNHGMNPTDVRHSLQLAYGILYDGYHQTRDDLELAAQEDRASGNSVVRSAMRYAVPTFLGPVVMATQVTYQLLGGLRNQLRPDAYQDERRKWGEKEVPGGINHK